MRKTLFSLLLLLPLIVCGQGGLVYDFTGRGSSWADGIPATAARVSDDFPYVATDAAGNVYVTGNGFNKVRKVDAVTGLISTVAGTGTIGFSGDGGPATAATTNGIFGITADATGNLYFVDTGNRRIRRVDAISGIITTVAGCGWCSGSGEGVPATTVQISPKGSPALDNAGNLIFPDYGNNKIRKVNLTSGIITTVAGCSSCTSLNDGSAAISAMLPSPTSVVLDHANNIYIYSDYRIRKVNATTGIITTIAGNGTCYYDGDYGYASNAKIHGPVEGICMDPAGNILFPDNGKIRAISLTTGIIKPIGGGGSANPWGGIPLSATGADWGLTADIWGNIYSICSLSVSKITSLYTTFAADSFTTGANSDCLNTQFLINIPHVAGTTTITTDFGDATSLTSPVTPVGTGGYASFTHTYPSSGTYNVKNIMQIGGVSIDSITYPYTFAFCNQIAARFYYDDNTNCTYETGVDKNLYIPTLTEISVNGVVRDTISATNGFDYIAYGNPNDIVALKIVSSPPGVIASCPSTGIIYDTLQSGLYTQPTDLFAINCLSSGTFDLQEYATIKAGTHAFTADILLSNGSCNLHSGTLTMNLSPKYNDIFEASSPTTVSGHTLSWDISGLSSIMKPILIHTLFNTPIGAPVYMPGDTVNSNYQLTPQTGDIQPVNNSIIVVDTVKSGFDPNYIEVSPEGFINSGRTLQYTISFENTGNDTAHNIYILDTLSEYLDKSSLRLLIASHVMNVSSTPFGQSSILKFDFPNINLEDSSHHDACHGMLVYTIKVRNNLPYGTIIPNQAGIYFDANPVVTTNTVNNIIGWPTGIVNANKTDGVLLFPNPTNERLSIKTQQGDYSSLIITSSIGNVVMSHEITSTTTQLDVHALPSGIYYVSLRGATGVATGRFVKL